MSLQEIYAPRLYYSAICFSSTPSPSTVNAWSSSIFLLFNKHLYLIGPQDGPYEHLIHWAQGSSDKMTFRRRSTREMYVQQITRIGDMLQEGLSDDYTGWDYDEIDQLYMEMLFLLSWIKMVQSFEKRWGRGMLPTMIAIKIDGMSWGFEDKEVESMGHVMKYVRRVDQMLFIALIKSFGQRTEMFEAVGTPTAWWPDKVTGKLIGDAGGMPRETALLAKGNTFLLAGREHWRIVRNAVKEPDYEGGPIVDLVLFQKKYDNVDNRNYGMIKTLQEGSSRGSTTFLHKEQETHAGVQQG